MSRVPPDVGGLKEEQTEKYAEGKIISQSRLAGSTISKGSNLTVTYAIKPKPVPSPSPKPEEEDKEEDNSGE